METLLGPESLGIIGSASVTAFAVVFGAGFAMGFAPSAYPLYSVTAGLVVGNGAESTGRGLSLSAAFVLGTATVDAVTGALFGLLGRVVLLTIARNAVLWNLVLAGALALFGLALLRRVRVPWPAQRRTWRMTHSVSGAYALGLPFGLTACPACAAVVLPMLGVVAATGSWWFGAALMFVFGVARGLPLLIVGTGAGTLTRLRQRSLAWARRLEWGSGVVLLAASAYFLARAFSWG